MRHRTAPALAAVSLALLLAGCAQVVDGSVAGTPGPASGSSGPSSSTPDFPSRAATPTSGTSSTGAPTTGLPERTPSSTASPSSGTPTTGAWVTVKDAKTGIRFQLPARPKGSTTFSTADDGTRLRNSIYTYQAVDGDSGIIVGVSSGATERITVDRSKFGGIGASLVTRLKGEGATNVSLIQKKRGTLRGHALLCYRFRYTPADPTVASPAWRICEIDDGSAILSTQVVDFPAQGDEPAALMRTLAVQNRVLAGLSLS